MDTWPNVSFKTLDKCEPGEIFRISTHGNAPLASMMSKDNPKGVLAIIFESSDYGTNAPCWEVISNPESVYVASYGLNCRIVPDQKSEFWLGNNWRDAKNQRGFIMIGNAGLYMSVDPGEHRSHPKNKMYWNIHTGMHLKYEESHLIDRAKFAIRRWKIILPTAQAQSDTLVTLVEYEATVV